MLVTLNTTQDYHHASALGMHWQRGLSMIESLVALLVLALGIMGLAGVQARLVAETRTTNGRAIAVGLIDDLTNRMLLNRDGALAGSYNLALGAADPGASDCTTGVCSVAQRANTDLSVWRADLTRLLPGARSTVFQSVTDSRQTGILVAWPMNEGKAAYVGGGTTIDTTYTAPFGTNTGIAAVTCPADFLCHLVYFQP
jgi:type IV pilus assembly protein PilV